MDELRKMLLEKLHEAGAEGGNYGFPRGPYKIQQHAEEFVPLVLWLDEHWRGGRYLEIGCAAAGTARFLDEWLGFDEATLLDDGRHRDAELRAKNVAAMSADPVRQLIMDSHSGEARLALTGLRFDLALVDGDHTRKGCLQDLQLAVDHLVQDGILIVHDSVASAGVREALAEFDFDAHGFKQVGHAHAGGRAPGTTWYRKD